MYRVRKTDHEMFLELFVDEFGHVPRTRYELCPRCEGEGKHVNEAIDGNGISAEEWYNEWDDDSREMYLSGGYDVICTECGGQKVIKVPDLEAMTQQERDWIDNYWQESRAYYAECEQERRMGC